VACPFLLTLGKVANFSVLYPKALGIWGFHVLPEISDKEKAEHLPAF
jgi:hypothetical protein